MSEHHPFGIVDMDENAGSELTMKFYSNRSEKKGYSWETPPKAVAESDLVESAESEVLVIGGGISGLAAAARLREKGLKVTLLDKNKKMMALAGQIFAHAAHPTHSFGCTVGLEFNSTRRILLYRKLIGLSEWLNEILPRLSIRS